MPQDISQFTSWFADFLTGFRVQRRLTVEAFALKLGVSAQLVYAYENENKPIGKATIHYIDGIISRFAPEDDDMDTLMEARETVYTWYLIPSMSVFGFGEEQMKMLLEEKEFYAGALKDFAEAWRDSSLSTYRLLELFKLKIYSFYALCKITQTEGTLNLFYLRHWFEYMIEDIEDIQRRGDHPRPPEKEEESPPSSPS